jgi:glycosyltransferase involved in cell wall biosynthesis
MSNKVYVLPPGEGWIVDRFVKEWNEDNADISVEHPKDADVIWLLADWCWEKLAYSGFLTGKKVITTVHHIVPEKFGSNELNSFIIRDKHTTVYHVYNQQTKDFIGRLTNKPIHLITYWANQKIWKKTADRNDLRKKYSLPIDGYIIGSFQRDTEGKDLVSPKLEKGPDLFANFVEKLSKERNDVHVLLAGWRRQYIIERLKSASIPFTYVELPEQKVINDLYQTLDLYPITARCEGGPQSIIECGLLGIEVISRKVGIASQVLKDVSISDDIINAIPSVPYVENWKLPIGYNPYRKLIASL